MKPKFVVHHFGGRTIGNLHNMCHFISSHSSNRTMSRACLMLSPVMAIDGCLAALLCVTFVRPFCLIFQSIRTCYCGSTLFLYCAESLRRIAVPDTPSDHSFLVHTESRAAIINGKAATMEIT